MVGAETHWIGGCRRAKNGVIRKGMRCDGFIQEPIEDFDIAKQRGARQQRLTGITLGQYDREFFTRHFISI